MKTYRRFMIGAIATLAVPLMYKPAISQSATGPPCADRARVIEALRAAYGQYLFARGLSNDGLLMEVYTAPTGTWTLIYTSPAGRSCLLGSGEAWEPVRSEIARGWVPEALSRSSGPSGSAG